MEQPKYEYDVAISFLGRDHEVARALRSLIAPGLRVFEFTGRQEEIAGTDGLVTFRTVFGRTARLVVVLFRRGWGDTPWTRVEAEAITDRFLREGPGFLLFVMLDSESPAPPWLPDKRIRFHLEQYGIEQAAGAIKLRVEELGGCVGQETMAERARRTEELQHYEAETAALKRDSKGVEEAQKEATNLAGAILRHAEEAGAAAPGLRLEWASAGPAVGVRSPRASLYVQFVVHYVNSLNDAFLSVEQMQGNIILPGEARRYLGERPVVRQVKYEPDRTLGLGWGWRHGSHLFSSESLAENSVRQLLERIERESRKRT